MDSAIMLAPSFQDAGSASAFALPGASTSTLRGALRPQVGSSLSSSSGDAARHSRPGLGHTLLWSSPLLAALAGGVMKRSSNGRREGCSYRLAAAGKTAEVEAEPAFDPSKEVGVTLPLKYWDPAGFCKENDPVEFRKFREAEIKHGRVAMMAALGLVIQHNTKFPGFEAVPAGVTAVATPPGTYGLLAVLLLSGVLEAFVWVQDPNKEPGNFGDPLGLGYYQKEWRNRELNNGRFAMIASIAIIFTELVTGKDGVEQILTPLGNLEVE